MSEPTVEAVVDGETTEPEPSGTRSGEKRPIESGGDCEVVEPQLSKKARNCPQLGRNLRRVAEIVLVMSTMAAVRGGKKPSDAEVELMAEARAKLVEICEGLAPKDIVGREGIGSVIEDLGLNGKVKDQKLGFRGPRLSIAEKLVQAKRKMEEPKKYIPPSAYGSHPAQTNFTPSVESRAALPTVRVFPSEKTSRVTASAGGSAPSLPQGHISATGSAPIQVQLPSNEVRAHAVSSGFPINHQGRGSSSFLHGAERQLNGTYGSQMQVNHPLVSAPAWSAQTQSALSAKGGPEQKLPNHFAVSVQGTTDSIPSRSTPQSARDQSSRPSISQTVTGNMPGLQSPLQGMNFAQAPSLSNNHNEITKIIQKLLLPQLPNHPTWNPPSRDYMNKAVTCQTCQITINEVDSILICDACEKGFHLKCVQSPNQRVIPRGEWHCSRCLTISNGKPLPPKYGRVMRSNPPPKVSMNTSGVQPSEMRSGTIDQKDNASQLKLVSNGGSDLQSPRPVDHGSNANESSGNKFSDAGEIHGNHFVTISRDIDEKPTTSTSLNIPDKSLGPELSSERSAQHIKNSESPKGEDGSKGKDGSPESPKGEDGPSESPKGEDGPSESPKGEDEPSESPKGEDGSGEYGSSASKEEPPKVSQMVADNFNGPDPLDNPQIVDPKMASNSSEKTQASRSPHSTSNVKKEDHEILLANYVENSEVSVVDREQSGTSSDNLCDVEWIGKASSCGEGKAYYKSCRVDGVTYKVQDFALFASSNGRLVPFRLQSFCQDSKNGLKWAILKKCYFPDEVPENVIRPRSPECNEVYFSERYVCLMVGAIRGLCELLPDAKFKEENERRRQLGPGEDHGMKTIFLCNWLFSEVNGIREFLPYPS